MRELMAENNALLKMRPPKINESMLQSEFFVRQVRTLDFKRGRFTATQHLQLLNPDFNLTGCEFWVDEAVTTITHFTG
ncbi:MAG: hypothetical protein ACK58T_00275, partial [Phycisphaerae bacterium]